MPRENSASTKATSIESEIGAVHLLSSHPREEPKTLGCLDALTIPELPTEPLDRPRSLDVALPQHPYGRVVREGDHGAAAVAGPPVATIPSLPAQSEV
jgi:hypothetical protein